SEAITTFCLDGKEPGDLQFAKGDIIILRRKVDDNWYHGELNGCHGFLPASYIVLLRPLNKDQDKDCLAFSKVHTHTCTDTHTLSRCNPLCVHL
uniref:SH3 domain-containing protein n=1 Tax=Hucho hucho TaxID=62062 RepID=A0A4W5JI33_9TELE